MSIELSPAELRAIRDHIDDESDLQKFLKAGFESRGWDVILEANPDHSDLRVDMVLVDDGDCKVGIELKYQYSGDGLTKVGRAVQKIKDRYSQKRYFGERIPLWAIGIYGRWFSSRTSREQSRYRTGFCRGKREAAQNLLNAQNIGYVHTDKPFVCIDFSPGDKELSIPGFPVKQGVEDWYDNTIELDIIQEKAGVSS